MNLRKAAEMALEALEIHVPQVYKDRGYEPIQALRQALAQPEQEPVAWLYQTAYGDKFIHKKEQAAFHEPNGTFTPLYTAPPKREWVGLTDEEIKEIIGPWGDTPIKGYTRQLFDKIEAKLKEKNT